VLHSSANDNKKVHHEFYRPLENPVFSRGFFMRFSMEGGEYYQWKKNNINKNETLFRNLLISFQQIGIIEPIQRGGCSHEEYDDH
jgi:hypothetical protein